MKREDLATVVYHCRVIFFFLPAIMPEKIKRKGKRGEGWKKSSKKRKRLGS